MTNEINHILEILRAGLRNAESTERREIEAELELALAERAILWAEQDGHIDAKPPFQGGLHIEAGDPLAGARFHGRYVRHDRRYRLAVIAGERGE